LHSLNVLASILIVAPARVPLTGYREATEEIAVYTGPNAADFPTPRWQRLRIDRGRPLHFLNIAALFFTILPRLISFTVEASVRSVIIIGVTLRENWPILAGKLIT
jgi:hypothetical protein